MNAFNLIVASSCAGWTGPRGRYAHVINFGAVGDGRTDDQPAIQRAIDYCSNNGIETLYFNSGVYYLSSTATGTNTPYTGNGVGYGAGENLNIGYYPEPLSAISYGTMYNNINYRPTNPRKINLSLIGTGTTILSARKEDRVTRFGGQASIIALRENINNFKMKGLSLLWDGNLTGDQEFQAQGVIIASNYGGATYGRSAFWPIDRNKIDIVDCTFINCSRSISSGSSILSGRGTNTVNITGCNFLYPKGSDSTSTAGGSQVLLFGYDTLNLNIVDNFAEGTSYIPVRSPNYKAKDGFVFFGGVNNRYERNTLARFDIETIYGSTGSPTIYCSATGSRVPYVGGTITLTAADIVPNPGGSSYSSISILTAYQGFGIGDIVSYVYNTENGGATYGVYRIDNLVEKSSIASYEIRATRLSGANYGGEFANLRVATVGRQLSSANFIAPFNFQNKIGSKTYVLDNTFTAGLALSSPTKTEFAHNPAVRADAGYVYLSGNSMLARWAFFGNGQIGLDFKSEWMVENNTLYCCSSADTIDLSNLNNYKSTVRNNSFYFWSDFLNNNALVYTAPRKITNSYRGGTSWAGTYINWGQDTIKQTYPLGADVGSLTVVNNTYYCTYPLSANTINTVMGTTKFDIVSGNTISNTINVSQFGAVGDGVTDDQPAIQAAIDYCSNNGIETLLFDSKTYLLSSQYVNSQTITRVMSSTPSVWVNNEIPVYLASARRTGFLLVGYNPTSSKYFKLNFIGTGSTKLIVNAKDTRVADPGGILSLRPNLTASKITGITFEHNYLSAGYPEYSGIGINTGGYSPTQFCLAYYTDNIDRQITIDGNNFINCHSAIYNSSYSLLSSSKLTLDVSNNNFYAPRGGDTGSQPMSPGNLGGTTVTGDVHTLICRNNFAEGTTYLPVRGYSPIDGFLFGSYINSTIENNHLTRFGVEGLALFTKSITYIGKTITIPATGSQITIEFNNLNYSNWTDSSWREYIRLNFVTDRVVTFNTNGTGGRDGSAGKYRIDSYNTTTIPGSATFTRLSTTPWEQEAEFGVTTGANIGVRFISLYNPTEVYGVSHTIKNNLFEASDPSIRCWYGNTIIENNTFYQHSSSIDSGNLDGSSILMTLQPDDPFRKDIIRNNTFYLRGYDLPKPGMSIATYKPEIYNNIFNYTFDSDNVTPVAAKDIPQLFVNTGDGITPYNPSLGFNPVVYNGIDTYGTTSRYLSAYDNTYNFFIPLSVQNMFCYSGDNTDTFKNNNINIYNLNTAQDLRNTYNSTFKGNYDYYGVHTQTISSQAIKAYVSTDTFTFNPTSVAADDNVTIIKPTAVGNNSGRWLKQ